MASLRWFAVVALAVIACGDDSGRPDTSSSGGDTSGAGGATTSAGPTTTSGPSTSSASTSSSSSSTGGGEGGEGGGPPPATGVPGKELVNAGEVMTSRSYKLHTTIGQPSPIQNTPTSTNHQMRGGVTGTTQ